MTNLKATETEAKAKQASIRRSLEATNSVINAAFTIDAIHGETLDLNTVALELKCSVERVHAGNTHELEAIMMAQAQTLDAVFHRILSQITQPDIFPQLHALSDIALRAQNQCRKTLIAIAELKNPKRATFIKQQNNALNQQINNSNNLKKSKKVKNKLVLEASNEKLDFSRQIKTIPTNQTSEALAVLNGTKDTRGKKE